MSPYAQYFLSRSCSVYTHRPRRGFLAAVPATPTNLTIVGGQYTNDTTPTFTWTAVPGATHYDYKMNDDNYRGLGNVTSFTSPTVRDGWHTFTLRALDGTATAALQLVTFEVGYHRGPNASAMTPTTATVAQQITLSTTASSEAWTSSCRLNVDRADVGTMHERNQTFSLTTTFSATGKHKVFATCVDGDGNTTVGSATTMTVNASWQAGSGSIIKTTGSSTVTTVTTDFVTRSRTSNILELVRQLRQLARGERTASSRRSHLATTSRSRPGSALVRFTTDNNVYAVDEGATLRKYLTAYLALLDYGTNWTSLL